MNVEMINIGLMGVQYFLIAYLVWKVNRLESDKYIRKYKGDSRYLFQNGDLLFVTNGALRCIVELRIHYEQNEATSAWFVLTKYRDEYKQDFDLEVVNQETAKFRKVELPFLTMKELKRLLKKNWKVYKLNKVD